MFPLRDDNPTISKSITTFLIIAVTAGVWIFVQGLGFEPSLSSSVCRFGLIPGELLGRLPAGFSIRLSRETSCAFDGQPHWVTLISSMFMHGGWFHIIGNLWFLAVFGDNVEDAMGKFRFIVFYLLCGVAAAGLQIITDPSSAVPMVGASGAISGVMGAYVVLYPRSPVHMLIFLGFFIDRIIVPAYFMLGYWFVIQILGALPSLGQSGGVAFFAHVGGFIAGMILIFIFKDRQRVEMHRQLLEDRWRYR